MKNSPLIETIIETISERILSGEYPGGYKLSENTISSEFSCSRTPVREALKRLAARESRLLREYERAARTFMDEMGPEDYAFCALYYLAGLSLSETAEALERSERQCLRYKRRIEEECADEGSKCHEMSACQANERVVR